MENLEEYTKKKKRGRKEMPPEKKKKGVTGIFSPSILEKLDKDTEKGIADTRGQRIVQIVEKFYRELDERNPPW